MGSIVYRRIVDLSQEISPDLQVFPSYPKPVFIPWTTRERHGFLSEALFMVSHSGTHVDAPLHYRPEGKALHELPVTKFVVPCRLLDLRP
ncbi:MAG TPA: cyclase family protein, partial [Thermoplasmata archaeon]|nr:cyclase family protein [Thermoplasmata archaeon]